MSPSRLYLAPFFALVLFTLLGVLLTLPLALQASTHLLGTDSNALNDTYFSVWIFGWQAHQLIADPLNLFQGNIFYPFPNSLAFSEIILPGALMYLPFEYATANPVLAYNLVVILSFPLNAFAMYLYALDWLGARNEKRDTRTHRTASYAAFVGGLIFAFSTYKMGELRHVQLLMSMFMPLTLMYTARFLRAPNVQNAVLTAVFFALNALASLYYAVFLALALVIYLGVELARMRFRLTRRHVLYGALSALLATVALIPFFLPFLQLEREYNFSEGRDPRLFSARPYSYIAAPASQWLYGNLTRDFYVASKGQPLFPGIAALALGGMGLVAAIRSRDRRWIFPFLLGVTGVILSFGPQLVLGRTSTPALSFPLPYYFLSLVITPLKSLNAPARFAVIAMLALALLAAYGAFALLRRRPRFASALACVAAALILLEYAPVPLRLAPVPTRETLSPAFTFLAAQPKGEPVVELPMGKPEFADQDKHVGYTYRSLYYLQPLINGYSTFLPPAYYTLVENVQSFPSRRAVKRLKKWGARWAVVNAAQYPNQNALRQKIEKLARFGITPVQEYGDVWLYRLQ